MTPKPQHHPDGCLPIHIVPHFKTLEEAKGWLGYDMVLRAVNAYEKNQEIRAILLEARRIGVSDPLRYIDLLEKAISKATEESNG